MARASSARKREKMDYEGYKESSDIIRIDKMNENQETNPYMGGSTNGGVEEQGTAAGYYMPQPMEVQPVVAPEASAPQPAAVQTPQPAVAPTPQPAAMQIPQPAVAPTPQPVAAQAPQSEAPHTMVTLDLGAQIGGVFDGMRRDMSEMQRGFSDNILSRIDHMSGQTAELRSLLEEVKSSNETSDEASKKVMDSLTEILNKLEIIGNEAALDTDAQTRDMIDNIRQDIKDMQQSFSDVILAKMDHMSGQTTELKTSLEEFKANAEKSGVTNKEVMDSLAEIQKKLDSNDNQAIKDSLNDISLKVSEPYGTDLEGSFDEINKNINTVKEELTDIMHTENVKALRNIRDFIKEDRSDEDSELSLDALYKKLKGRITVATIIMILNLGLVGVLIMAILGII